MRSRSTRRSRCEGSAGALSSPPLMGFKTGTRRRERGYFERDTDRREHSSLPTEPTISDTLTCTPRFQDLDYDEIQELQFGPSTGRSRCRGRSRATTLPSTTVECQCTRTMASLRLSRIAQRW